MESWFQRIFLIMALGCCLSVAAQEDEDEDDRSILDAVISPDLERRKIDESKIDSENFEFGFYAGVMSIEDFGTQNSYGLTMAYHINEDWFFEAGFGTAKASKTSFEVLSGSSDLIDDETDRFLTYYSMSLGLNLFPGEIFLGDRFAFNTSYYVIFGVGNTKFAGDEFFTYNFGTGFRIFATDWVAIRVGFRNHLFTHDVFGVDKSVQNLEAQIGLSLYF